MYKVYFLMYILHVAQLHYWTTLFISHLPPDLGYHAAPNLLDIRENIPGVQSLASVAPGLYLGAGQVERGGTVVALDLGVGLGGHDKLVVGDQVSTSLVGARGDWLRDGESKSRIAADDGESSGGLLASALRNIRQSSVGVGAHKCRALDTGGLHCARLQDGEGVPKQMLGYDSGPNSCRVEFGKTYEHWVL